MGIKYLWDTNIAIYYLQQQFTPLAEQFIDRILQDSEPAISAITEIELLCWKSPSEKDQKILNSFIEDAVVFELEKDIKLKTAVLRKQSGIKLPDAIIAATAIVYDLILVTRNTHDFKHIEGLNLVNPYDM